MVNTIIYKTGIYTVTACTEQRSGLLPKKIDFVDGVVELYAFRNIGIRHINHFDILIADTVIPTNGQW